MKELKDLSFFRKTKDKDEEIENDTNKQKRILYSWIGRINIVKKPILPKTIYRLNIIPVKIPMTLLKELEQVNLKLIWDQKNPNNQNNLKKKEQSSKSLPDFRPY